jgi:hypothetical protein
MRRPVVVLGLLAVLILASPTRVDAIADLSWSMQTTPTPIGDPSISAEFTGVSCGATSACQGVGYYFSTSANTVTKPFAQGWNGTSWTNESVPVPTGTVSSRFFGVSCSSGTACTAVGTYRGHSGDVIALAERWNGRAWTIQSTPSPGSSIHVQLSAVSCPSATSCTAVGWYFHPDNSDVPSLAEHWNGTSWVIQTTPSTQGQLEGVSCESATVCTAVGEFYPSALTMAERLNGSHWTVVTTPSSPPGTQSSNLTSVSCRSATFCVAVGYYVLSSFQSFVIAERWNGTHWTTQPALNPGPEPNNQLYGVSCPTTSACSAVGNSSSGPGGTGPLVAERWNGSSWTVQPITSPSDGGLQAIACRSSSSCTAVGFYDVTGQTPPLAERYS